MASSHPAYALARSKSRHRWSLSHRGGEDAGLFFLAFVVDPRTHFIPMQTRLGLNDGLSEYVQHTGSALFAVPPGIAPGEYVGQSLFS